MKTISTFGLALSLGLFLTSCSSSNNENNNENAALSGTVVMDGSSTVYPLSEAVAEEFRAIAPDVNVTIGSSGSGAGFKKFARGESDISNASRAIKQNEIDACTEANITFKEIRVALDGIAIVTSKENTWLESITVAELKMIWAPESKVKQWSDIRPEWPSEDIELFGPSTAHGTYDFFTEEIMGEAGASRPDYNAVSDYNVAVQGVSNNKNALGYFGLAYYTENSDKLKLIAVDNGNGAVLPSLETVGNGTYSPLARPLFIYVKEASLERPEVRSFVEFYIKNAASLSKAVGYIPLNDSEYADLAEQLGSATGTEQ